jgi:cell division transport system permease protein
VFTNSQMKYLAGESLAVFRRMKGMSLVSTLIMSVALLMLALFTLVTVNLQGVAASFRSGIEVSVFLRGEPTVEEVQALRQKLLEQAGVETVAYVSKQDALVEFREQLGADSDLVDVLEENPLPASLRITMRDEDRRAARLEMLAGWLRELPEVDEVRYGDQWVKRLEEYIRIFVTLDLLIGAIVLLSALFVISNTVRLTVMARGRTIEVMRLVGATNWFIRMPFLIEGAVQGAVAGGLAMLVLGVVHHYAQRVVGPMAFYDTVQIVGFVLLCSVVCAMGSLSSLHRFLRL